MTGIREWLRDLGLEEFAEQFELQRIDLEAARHLNDPELKELGLPMGPRLKVLAAIQALIERQSRAAAPEESNLQSDAPRAAERRQLTVLFCDLVGSSELSRRLDPEEYRDLVRAYQSACADIVARFEGHIAQHLGDGLLVYFGYPRAHEDDAQRAVRAGLGLVDAVSALTGPAGSLAVRVGIDTGLVVVGDVGSGILHEQLALGDAPNVAARLQALAMPGTVLLSAATKRLVAGSFLLHDVGAQAVKGIAEGVHTWQAIAENRGESRFEVAQRGAALTPLVGRDEEIALLLRRWQQTLDGEGQLVLVGGEAGIGKSRLTRVLRERLSGEAYSFLRYQCSPYHTNSALYPFIEQLERAAGFLREDPVEVKLDKMQALLAGNEQQVALSARLYAALLSLPTDRYAPANLSSQKQKEKTLQALSEQLELLAQRQPVLMVFEDAHWIDATSQELLDLVVQRQQTLPVLLIVTHRPEYTPPWVGQPSVTSLTLTRLARRQRGELVSRLTNGKALPQEVLEKILTHTDGVPLFVEELTKSVLESKLLREEDDHYVLDGPLPALAIPTTLRDSLIARLDRLAPIREIAQIGACIGREFSYELLAALAPMQGSRLTEALEQLTQAGLVFRRGVPPASVYTFKHALVQDAAHDSLLKSKRAQLHAQIAGVLEERFPATSEAEPETLAYHYTAAGLLDQAIAYWRKAGELAFQRMALNEAIAHLNKGLELARALPVSLERDAKELALRTALGTAWMALRGWAAPEVEASFAPALKLAKALDHRPSYLPVLSGLFVHDLVAGRIAESLEWVREMQEAAETLADEDLRLEGHRMALLSHFYLGRLQEAQLHADRIAVYDPEQGRHIETFTNHDPLTARGVFGAPCLWLLGYPDQALQLLEATEAHARAGNHPFDLCYVLTIGSLVLDLRGDVNLLLTHAEEAERLARTHTIPLFFEVLAPLYEAIAAVRSGQAARGVATLRAGLAKWNSLGGYLRVPYYKSVLAEGLVQIGNVDEGIALIQECLAQIERRGWEERVHLAEVLRLKSSMLELQGELDEAEQDLCAAIDVAREQQAKSLELRATTSLARLFMKRGARGKARELLVPIYQWFTEGFDTWDLKNANELLQQLS